MIVLNKIYTRTGDDGHTALGDGERVAKYAPRVATYGTVDELNATVGVARAMSEGSLQEHLAAIQNDLFDLGADLSRPIQDGEEAAEMPPLRVIASQVDRLESEIDAMTARLEPLRSFVLPGGNAMAAQLHVCRTVARRAERLAVELAALEDINAEAVKYLNRLSDWFFAAARIANDEGRADVLWVPGANRS